MSGAADDGLCGIKWCDEQLDHAGPHRRYLFEEMAVDMATGRPAAVMATLQGSTADDRVLTIVAGVCEVTLPWRKTRQLGQVLRDQARMHGAP